MIKIEKQIPIPRKSHAIGFRKYPFDSMEVGDSFFAFISVQSLSTCANNYVKSIGNFKRFTTRKQNNGARVWRIK